MRILMKTVFVAFCVFCLFSGATAFADPPGNPNVVEVSGVQGANVFNQDVKTPDIVGDKRFTGNEIETAILKVRDDLITVRNSAEDMDYKKRNPIKGDLQNFDVGAHDDITKLMAEVSRILGEDFNRFDEKDPHAIPMIPIPDTGYMLPTDTEINVIGGSAIQAYPLKVDGEIIGHFRAVCGGYQTDDVLINNDSVSYCVTSIEATGVSRNSGVHKDATTQSFFYGVTEPYMVGKVAKVKVNWYSHPKSTLEKVVEYYNLQNVPNGLASLEFKTILTMQDGTRLAGTNAEVSE